MTFADGATLFAWETLLRLLVASVIGGLIGFERQVYHRAIGVAGMTLVALGSTAYMLLAQHLAGADPSAPGRALQGILQGIGFLGGAVIFKGGTNVRGIKTAASIWIAGVMGLALGTDLWSLGLVVGLMTVVILFLADRRATAKWIAEESRQGMEQRQDEEHEQNKDEMTRP